MMPSFELDAVDYFTAGTIGPPGEREFYMQGREAASVVTLKVEKEQMRVLADYLTGFLAKLPKATEKLANDLPLLEPATPAWAVGSIGVGYDEARDRVVVVAEAMKEQAEDEAEHEPEQETEREAEQEAEADETGPSARFAVTRAQAAAFVERVRALLRAGRPICPMCANPIDPGGHVCPRANGHPNTPPP
jgi:uncharacterized repeat protein (TIGR03847 family)